MLTVEQAQETILSHIKVMGEENRPLLECIGQTLAEDLVADINVPDWDYSGMDGFALRAKDTENASPSHPRILRIIERVKAGSIAEHRVIPGTAVRIMTGAPLPLDSDCVIRFEDTDEEKQQGDKISQRSDEISILKAGKIGENIRLAGEKIRQGATVLSRRDIIGPAEIGILAALGKTHAKVVRRPVAAIISTGDELIIPGRPLSNSQIYSSNNFVIASEVIRCGGIPKIIGIARDNKPSLVNIINKGMTADLVITCGGTSGGDYDLVKEVVAKMGEIVFWQVRMNPGTPFAFGLVHKKLEDGSSQNIPLFALAGNSPANIVDFEVLVRPAIGKMMGKIRLFPDTVDVILEDSLENKKNLRRFVWARISKRENMYYARISVTQDKGIFPSIAAADGLVIIPEEKSGVEKGEKVQAMLLNWK